MRERGREGGRERERGREREGGSRGVHVERQTDKVKIKPWDKHLLRLRHKS